MNHPSFMRKFMKWEINRERKRGSRLHSMAILLMLEQDSMMNKVSWFNSYDGIRNIAHKRLRMTKGFTT